MSQSFLGFGQVPYIGQPQARAMKLGGIAAQAIPLFFDWLPYGASTTVPRVNVLVDLDTKPCAGVDYVRSVYIDNTGSDTPIYVYFPDTQYTIVAKPNSEGWYPAFTNQRKVWVIGMGFMTGAIPATLVILSNIAQIPAVNVELDSAIALWRASPIITRGTGILNTNLGIPALGDQTINYVSTIGAIGVFENNLWGTPYTDGFVYLTHVNLKVVSIGTLPLPSPGASLGIVIESTGPSGLLYRFSTAYPPGMIFGQDLMLNLSAMNIKLDATETWRGRCDGFSGFAVPATFNHTWNYTVSN